MSIRSHLLDVAAGRRKIRVFEMGEGRPLVFLHSAGGLAEDNPFLAALARHWHVFAPLLPGYGDSEGAESLATCSTSPCIRSTFWTRWGSTGRSWSAIRWAAFAAEMAAIAPREVERLGLIAPAGLWLDAHPIPDLFSKLPHELPGLLFHNPEFGERVMTAGADFDDPKFLEAFIIRNTRQLAMAGKMLFPIPDRGLDERLYRIRAKTVLIWGESDRVIPAAYGNAFCRGIAGAELVQIPAAGHMVIVEQPEAVVAALASLE